MKRKRSVCTSSKIIVKKKLKKSAEKGYKMTQIKKSTNGQTNVKKQKTDSQSVSQKWKIAIGLTM